MNKLRAPALNSLRLVVPTETPGAEGVGLKDALRAFGSFGIPYATGRVQAGTTIYSSTTQGANYLATTWPFRAVGRLTFRVGDFNSFCSASVIRPGIIVTAAHCIQDFGSGNNLFNSWVFTPAYYGPAASATVREPYGTWTARAVLRPSSWANGTDTGCGSARNNDLALIALSPQNGVFVGARTGRFSVGWNNYSFVTSSKTGNQHTAAMTTLGYPGLMDNGAIMQRTDGPTYTTTVCSAKQLWQGSAFTGGSSGGPWMVNFRGITPTYTGGASMGSATVMAVVGVTSWGASDPNTPKDNYSSQFAQNTEYPSANYGGYGAGNIGSLLNTFCNAIESGGQTYAQRGYC